MALGALWGVLFTDAVRLVVSDDVAALAVPMAIVGMAAFFGATVQAPLTGIVIVIEMTATTSAVIPMQTATVASVFTASFVGVQPIYDSLGHRM